MNGFANSILSILLSWIRALVANIWVMINSEGGGAAYRFFADHWLTILAALLIGGFVTDRIIYFFRWRPYYVWLSRWDKLRSRTVKSAPPEPEMEFPSEPVAEMAAETMVYQPASAPAPTIAYAPLKQAHSTVDELYTQVYQAPAADEPLFDEPVAAWDEEEAWEAPVSYVKPQAETNAYYRDVQAGFAPAISPEQLYASRQTVVQEVQQVHPGLDDEAFRQSFGLQDSAPQPVNVMRAPAFRPFTAVREDVAPARPQNAFSRFAKRARDLVSVEDENQPLSIRDLYSPVDVSQAFHEPVYPQNLKNND